jgi:hypothetical protein
VPHSPPASIRVRVRVRIRVRVRVRVRVRCPTAHLQVGTTEVIASAEVRAGDNIS